MNNWLEKKMGFLSIPGLAGFLTGMNAAVGLMSFFKPEFTLQLVLDWNLIRQGQIWRLVTYVFIPPNLSPLWLFFWLMLFYSFLQRLENFWGDFKMTLFCFLGAASTALASGAINAPLSNSTFNLSLFLAFMKLEPEFEILLFFFFPVKMKWLAAITWILTAWSFISASPALKFSLLAGLLNYFLFFGPDHWLDLKMRYHRFKNRNRFN